ncbi:MAG: YdeI/OmpD-associated family protein [Candidatus Micrarchaeota archaeon]|nr:YdeI/OmpD-associated family protein [Candidatus Micrarchaeota archaeon]
MAGGVAGEILEFKSAEGLERWLAKNHSASNGIWLRIYKKGSAANALKGSEVLDPLLCYGWITGQARRGDERSVLWWVCPRRARSLWSKINVGHAERLIKEGRMKPEGFRQIEAAKKDGRWDMAYSPQRTASLPADFLKEIDKNKKAKAFLKKLNKTNSYSIIFRLETTHDAERRKRKIRNIIDMLERGKTFH